MTFRLRAWLASFALCTIPSFADAQQFSDRCSTAPVALEARESLTRNAWDPADLIASLTPSRVWQALSRPSAAPPESAPGVNEAASSSQLAPIPAGLLGVDYCVSESERQQLAMTAKLEALAAQEPIDVVAEQVASPIRRPASSVSFSIMMPSFHCFPPEAKAFTDVAASTSSDSPVIVTLASQEEYVPYDLTAIDRVKTQLFPLGILPYGVNGPMFWQADADVQADAPVADTESVAKADDINPQPAEIPIDCLLDEFVWEASNKLRADSPLRRRLQTREVGRALARIVSLVNDGKDQMLNHVTAMLPAVTDPSARNSATLVASSSNQPAEDQPSVCCPLESAPAAELAETPRLSRQPVDLKLVGVDLEAALASMEKESHGVLLAEKAESASEIASVGERTPSESAPAVDPQLERAWQTLQQVVREVRSLSDRWTPRVASRPDKTAVR